MDHNHNDRDDNRVAADIEKYGCAVIAVEASDYLPPFAYSIGLWEKYNHPELICFGLGTDHLHTLLNELAEMIKAGEVLSPDKTYTELFETGKAVFLPIDKRNIPDYFGVAIDHYQQIEFPALQLVWTDKNDHFPWEPDFDEEFMYYQPLLDRNADFKFREPKNLQAFTTRQWIEEGHPIVHVIHDDEGDWLFLTPDAQEDDILVVALESLIQRDPTLNEVFDLEYGEEATRIIPGQEWTRQFSSEDEEEE